MEYLASYHQGKVWFVDKFERGTLYDGGPVYHNIPVILSSETSLNTDCLNKIFTGLCNTYEVLRTVMIEKDGIIYQSIKEEIEGSVEVINLPDNDRDEIKSKLLDLAESAFSSGLGSDLVKAYYVTSGNGFYFMLVLNYLICDHSTAKILRNDIVRRYKELNNGIEDQKNDQDDESIQYLDYSDWQRNLPKETLDSQVLYWKMKTGKYLQPLELPIDKKRALVHVYEADNIECEVPAVLSEKIRMFSSKKGIDERSVFLACFKIILSKFSGLQEINIGSWIDIREDYDMTGVAGPVDNIVLLKDIIEEDDSFTDILDKVTETYQEARENSLIPFDKLVTELKPAIDMSRTALFDVMFNYVDDDFSDSIFSEIDVNRGYGKFDYHLKIIGHENKHSVSLVYNSLYYTKKTAGNLLDTFFLALDKLTDDPEKKIGEISVISEHDKKSITEEWNNDKCGKVNANIVELLKEQCIRNSGKTAVKDGDNEYTYDYIDQASDKFASHLLSKGVNKEEFVAIFMEKDINCVIAILGVLKAGAAYLPIDPSVPKERQQYILKDSKARYVVVSKETESGIDLAEKIYVSDSEMVEDTDILKQVDIPSTNAAYMIYTSGTTGEPKGMVIEHTNLTSLIENNKEQLGLRSDDVWTMFHSYGFDFSVWELFGSLLTGATLVLISKSVARDTAAFYDLLSREKVTILNQTPLAFYALDAEDNRHVIDRLNVRKVIFGGEVLDFDKLKGWYDKYADSELINMYGITETTIHVTLKKISPEDIEKGISNIGRPLNGYTVYLVDRNMNLLPVGAPGEIVVGGTGLGRGYWNRQELTEERFINNPFGNGRLYHSGDLARWLPDGELEYLGRIDQQVKIRGYRIETGEISSRIKKVDGVIDCVVIAKKGSSNDMALFAYFTSDRSIEVSEIKDEIRNYLPDYMIPPYIMQIDSIPITKNGKLDKAMLPEISLDIEMDYVQPENEKQRLLCDLFRDILGVEKVGITNSFFEIGGDSIKAIRIVSGLREKGYTLSVKDIMTYKTAKALAEVITSECTSSLSNEIVTGEVIFTPIMHELNALNRGLEHIFWSGILEAESIDEECLRRSLDELFRHHDMLRAVCNDGKIIIRDCGAEPLYQLGTCVLEDDNDVEGQICSIYEDMLNSLKIDECLFGVRLIRSSGKEYLVIAVHHLIMDQVSWSIMLEDLETLYGAFVNGKTVDLPVKTTSFKRWAEELKEYAKSKKTNDQIGYWDDIDKEISQNDPQAKGTYDHFRYRVQNCQITELSEKTSNRLNTGLSTVFLATLIRNLKAIRNVHGKYSVMVEKHGREDIGSDIVTDRTIGWFTSIVPVVLEPCDDVIKNIVNTKEMLGSIPDKGLGYGLLKYSNKLSPDYGHSDIMYNYLGEGGSHKDNRIFTEIELPQSSEKTGSYDCGSYLSFNVLINNGTVSFDIEYDTGIYDKEDIRRLCADIDNELSDIMRLCDDLDSAVLSASDFELQGMDQDDFDSLLSELLSDEEGNING